LTAFHLSPSARQITAKAHGHATAAYRRGALLCAPRRGARLASPRQALRQRKLALVKARNHLKALESADLHIAYLMGRYSR
jgi:hypothetical protein